MALNAVMTIGNREDFQNDASDTIVDRQWSLLAKLRHRQLEMARQGNVRASARYARRPARLSTHMQMSESELELSCC